MKKLIMWVLITMAILFTTACGVHRNGITNAMDKQHTTVDEQLFTEFVNTGLAKGYHMYHKGDDYVFIIVFGTKESADRFGEIAVAISEGK